jgi:c-di-GMP-related signal transduction protein
MHPASPTLPIAAGSTAPTPGEEQVFIARQPVFEAGSAQQQRVYGYELLFRSSEENRYTATDGRLASSQTINRAVHSIGLEAVVGDKKAFINVPRDLLLEEIYCLLPPEQCVVEVSVDLLGDDAVLAACTKLRKAGYGLALDDVVDMRRVAPLAKHADLIKVNLPTIAAADREAFHRELKPLAAKLVAQRVETREDYEQALALGCRYVQGYFFCKPEMMRGKGLTSAEFVFLQFLRELNKPELDYAALERVIKQDVSISYKLLRYLNSASFALRHKVTSLREALVLLGERALRQWGTLVAVTSVNSKRPTELMITSLVRGRFCEAIAEKQHMTQHQLDMFFIGLLSSIDAALGLPMKQILEQTCVSDDVRMVLLNNPAAPKELARIYQLTLACERGAWGTVVKTSAGLRLTQGEIATIYYDALTWANQTFADVEE